MGSNGNRGEGAWAQSCQLDTRLSAANLAAHLAVFRIQTAGTLHSTVTFPEGTKAHAVWIDRETVDLSQWKQKQGPLKLHLPPGNEFVTVSLYYVNDFEMPRLTSMIKPVYPAIDLPTIEHRWRLWLPADCDVTTTDTHAHPFTRRSTSLSERFLGPLAKNSLGIERSPFSKSFWTLAQMPPSE